MSEQQRKGETDGISHVGINREGGRLVPDLPVAELGTRIDAGDELVIFDGAYSAEECISLRREIQEWSRNNDVWPEGVSASQPGINFHRVDDDSAPTSMPHIFHQFGFAEPGQLPAALGERLLSMRAELLDLQNQLAGTDFQSGTDEFRFKAMRHPRGGGYLVPHTHPYEPTRVALFLNLSEPGSDYHSGAARFHTVRHGWINTFEDFRIGDVLAWRYDLVHDIDPIDPGDTPVWEGDDGLWICAMEGTETHLQSGRAQ